MRTFRSSGLLTATLLVSARAAAAAEQADASPNIHIDPPTSDGGLPALPALPPPPPPPVTSFDPASGTTADAGMIPDAAPTPPATEPAAPPAEPATTALQPSHLRYPHERPARLTGWSFGLEAMYSIPFGKMNVNASEMNEISGVVSGRAVVGNFLTERLYVGGSFGAGLIPVVNICTDPSFATAANTTCSGYQVRMDVVAEWHFDPRSRRDWWVGGGAGYEWLHLSSNGSGGIGSNDTSAGWISGFEAKASGGLDWKPASELWAIGPFVELSAGHYLYDTFTIHGFVSLGLRVRSQL